MRRTSLTFALLFSIATIGAPAARATTYTATFDCIISGTSVCALFPTATNGPYTFPLSTAIDGAPMGISFDGVNFTLYLFYLDAPGDTYTWSTQFYPSAPSVPSQDTFAFNDPTANSYGTWGGNSTVVFPTENGTLFFTASAPAPPSLVPEPGSLALLFTGMAGLLLLLRKRIAHRLRRGY